MSATLTLVWLSGKYDLDPWMLYLGTLWIDLAVIDTAGEVLAA